MIPTIFDIPIAFDRHDEIIAAAKNAGWEQKTRSGGYATVLVRDNQALKIYEDTAYDHFLSQIQARENSTYPVILDGPLVGVGLSVIFLERLESLGYEDALLADKLRWYALESEGRGEIDPKHPYIELVRERMGEDGVSALDFIMHFAKDHAYIADFNIRNLMLRPLSNQIVFADPVSLN